MANSTDFQVTFWGGGFCAEAKDGSNSKASAVLSALAVANRKIFAPRTRVLAVIAVHIPVILWNA
jgi:hypothetical protein